METDSRDNLRRLAVVLESNTNLPPDLAEWLRDGLGAFLERQGTLCRCLGLRRPGERHSATVDAMRTRNRWLREAARHVALQDATAWQRAQRLAQAVTRFQGAAWPRLRARSTPPEADPLRAALWHAHKAGAVPTSAKRLYTILLAS